jgi:hypothetical protein
VGKGGSGKGTSFLEREKKERKTGEREREREIPVGKEERHPIGERATEIFEKKAIRDRALRLPDANERLGIETQN